MAFAGFLLLGLGASGLASPGLWLSGHEPPSPVWVSLEAFGMADGAHGWVAGRAGLCSCYLGLGSAAPAPRFLGTQPPYATQALSYVIYQFLFITPLPNSLLTMKRANYDVHSLKAGENSM